MALKQIISTKLDQRLSPQQIQLMKLLQVPTVELEQRIKQEIEENPALEEGLEISEDNYVENDEVSENIDEKDFNVEDYLSDDSDYKTRINNSGKDNEEKAIPLSGDNSFQERLINQIQLLNFNNQEYINKCIKSCLKQSYKNFEVIIYDDCSNDKSRNIIKNIKNKKIKKIFNKSKKFN